MSALQPDFGHHPTASAAGFLDAWGDGPLLIRHQGRSWRFEFSEMFGPLLLTAEGDVAARQPDQPNHPFWEPFNLWNDTGRKCRAVRTKRGKLRFWLCYVPRDERLY